MHGGPGVASFNFLKGTGSDGVASYHYSKGHSHDNGGSVAVGARTAISVAPGGDEITVMVMRTRIVAVGKEVVADRAGFPCPCLWSIHSILLGAHLGRGSSGSCDRHMLTLLDQAK